MLKSYTHLLSKAPRRWLYAILLALLTHPLLDAFTVYGTQLLWPLPFPPTMWSTIFIIDPLYTLPLLVGVFVAWQRAPREKLELMAAKTTRNWLLAGLIISSGYLTWSVVAKFRVEQIATQSLVTMGLQNAPRFSTPLAFNTLLWRVVVMAPDGYWIGDRSLIADYGSMSFTFYPSDTLALEQVASSPQIQRLLWFTQGFIAARIQQRDDGEPRLILADLRMGIEPDYFFRYDVAGLDAEGNWVVDPNITQLPASVDRIKTLKWVWQRLHSSDAFCALQIRGFHITVCSIL